MAITQLTEQNFDATLTQPGIVLVDFWAPWCGPCRAFGPIFERVAAKHPEATFAKLNTDAEQGLASALEIRSIPTLMVFRDGVLLYSQPGMLPEAALESLVTKAAALDMDKVKAEIASRQTETRMAANG